MITKILVCINTSNCTNTNIHKTQHYHHHSIVPMPVAIKLQSAGYCLMGVEQRKVIKKVVILLFSSFGQKTSSGEC